MRPAVEQLIRKGYPIKSIDIDQEPELGERYHVESVPTFIVVDGSGRELDRTLGPQPAAELARFYMAAAAKAQPPANSNAHVGSREDAATGAGRRRRPSRSASRKPAGATTTIAPKTRRERAEPAFTNPKPWETVVRIRVLSNRSTGFGSGTIIHSTPEESLILTCATSSSSKGDKQVAAVAIPAQDHDRPVRRQPPRDASRPRSTSSKRSKGGRSTTTSPATSG